MMFLLDYTEYSLMPLYLTEYKRDTEYVCLAKCFISHVDAPLDCGSEDRWRDELRRQSPPVLCLEANILRTVVCTSYFPLSRGP